MRKLRLVLALAGVLATAAIFAAVALADDDDGDGPSGFQTAKAAMLTCSECRANGGVVPIISVGDTPPGGYMFEAIPDGISLIGGGDDDDDFRAGRSDDDDDDGDSGEILINHELSLVAFPATRQDPSNSIVGRIRLNEDAEVLASSVAIPASAGYQRFCSNFLVDREHGFRRPLLFTNEEARDIVLRQTDSWHTPSVSLSEPNAEQAGVVVGYDVRNGTFKSIYGMGRHNHENSVALPGRRPLILSGDDTFDAPASQLYMYTAASGQDVWDDKGKLYAFVSDDSNNDYGDVTLGETVLGHFIEVPRDIATGKLNGDLTQREITSADKGYPTPSAAVPPTAAMPDGPQWVLEHWSNLNNAFQFIRIEDTAYDRRNSRIMYLADTGEPRAVPHATTTRLSRGGSTTVGQYMNGRLWKMELGRDPLAVGSVKLSILPNANFDLNGYANPNSPHQPDNVETTRNAIYFQEDPGGHQSSAAGTGTLSHFPPFPNATNARIWRYDLRTGELRVIAEVKQDVPGSPTTVKGTWESSGIVDASSMFGRGAFLVDVQAHGWDVPAGAGNDPPAVPQREQGQLLLIKVRNP